MTRIEILLHLSLLQKKVVEMQKQVDEVYSNISDLASLLQKEVTCEQCERVNAIHTKHLAALVNNRWTVSRDPSGHYKKFIVARQWLSWPECVLADGDTEMEAIQAAIDALDAHLL